MPPKRKVGVAPAVSSTRLIKRAKTARNGVAGVTAGDRQIEGFYRSPFMKEETIPDDLGCDLPPDIHLLFGRARFPGVDYAVLETPPRLATKLLQADVLKPMFYTALHHKPEEAPRKKGEKPKYVYRATVDKTDRRISKAMAQDIDNALRDLTQIVSFVRDDHLASGFVTSPTAATIPGHRYFRQGVGSRTRYAGSFFVQLSNARNARLHGGNDWPLLRTLQFDFAVSMVHEVWHMLYNALIGAVPWEPFFNGAAIAEAGYEAEFRLFGGHITPLFDQLDGAANNVYLYREAPPQRGRAGGTGQLSAARGLMVLWRWPERGVISSYGQHSIVDSHRAMLPKNDLAWRIPLGHFRDLFTQAFWEEY